MCIVVCNPGVSMNRRTTIKCEQGINKRGLLSEYRRSFLDSHALEDKIHLRQKKKYTSLYQKTVLHSSSHFSHFLAYLSSNCARSRMTNVSTTVAKNSEARFSFTSAAVLTSAGNAAYIGATGCASSAFECSSSNWASVNNRPSPVTYAAGESRFLPFVNLSN